VSGPHHDRRIIDTLVDARQNRDCFDVTAIPVPLNPLRLHVALGLPLPHGPHPLPNHVVYRGYRINALYGSRD
jgi:hypothetical protein